MSRAITESKWRNAKPEAPTLEFTAKKGQPTELPLTDYLVQGAKDLETGLHDQDVIERIGTQRGWYCGFFNTSRPSKGRLSRSLTGNGFRYTSAPWFVGQDCFTYVLNNGFQNSEPGQIIINVEDYGQVRILIEEDTARREKNKRYFRYVAQWYPKIDLKFYDLVVVTWYVHEPIRYVKNGVTYVRVNKRRVQTTTVTQDVRYSYGYRYLKKNWRYPADGSFVESVWPDPKFYSTIDESTGTTYFQPAGPWPVSVDVSFRQTYTTKYRHYFTSYRWNYRYRAEWGSQETLSADVRSLYGDGWWRRGHIFDVHADGFVPNDPGTFTPITMS